MKIAVLATLFAGLLALNPAHAGSIDLLAIWSSDGVDADAADNGVADQLFCANACGGAISAGDLSDINANQFYDKNGNVATAQDDMTLKKSNLATFPLQLDEWTGQDDSIDTEVANKLGFTEYVMINYHNSEQRPVNFYVAYYASQRKGVSPHSPKVCIPGGGWEIADFSRTTVDQMPVNRVVIRKGVQDQIVYYWFEERGVPVANEYIKKWMLFKDALFLNRTDGSLIRVTTPVLGDESIEDADRRAQAFIRSSRNQLLQLLPAKSLEGTQ